MAPSKYAAKTEVPESQSRNEIERTLKAADRESGWSWHEEQSVKIRTADRAIREAENTIAFAWWETGQRLNDVYGYPRGTGNLAGRIPGADMARLCEIYQITDPVLRNARRFNSKCRSREEALQVIEDYGTWLNIIRGFLVGTGPDEAREKILQKKRDDYQDRAKAYHMNNVPDRLLSDLMENGGITETEARYAVRHFIERLSYMDVLAAWRARERLEAAS